MKHSMQFNQEGFTLIELCVAMAILVIAGFVAIPHLASLQSRWQLQTVTQSAITTLNAARIQAMKLNSTISVCASADGRQCGSFDPGSRYWLISNDRDNAILRSIPIAQGYSLQGASSRTRVRFQPNGWSSGTNMTLRICDSANVWRKDVIVSNAGRIRSQTHREHEPC